MVVVVVVEVVVGVVVLAPGFGVVVEGSGGSSGDVGDRILVRETLLHFLSLSSNTESLF